MRSEANVARLSAEIIRCLNIVEFPAPNHPVSQSEIKSLIQSQREAREASERCERLEAELLSRLQAGATVEHGEHRAWIGKDSRRNVAWKAVAARLAGRLGFNGAAYCLKVLKATKPSTTFSLKAE